jgi:hypothetical protein
MKSIQASAEEEEEEEEDQSKFLNSVKNLLEKYRNMTSHERRAVEWDGPMYGVPYKRLESELKDIETEVERMTSHGVTNAMLRKGPMMYITSKLPLVELELLKKINANQDANDSDSDSD